MMSQMLTFLHLIEELPQMSHQHEVYECYCAAFVPEGPEKQLEMYFHAVQLIKVGKEQVHLELLCSAAVLECFVW